jgi:L-amino acid N-acyltransferase YncA
MSGEFFIRKISLNDSSDLLILRNASSNLPFFRNPYPVSPSEHDEWIMKRVQNHAEETLVAIKQGIAVGIIYLDEIQNLKSQALISIRVTDSQKNLGVGNSLLLAIEKIARERKYRELRADVHNQNSESKHFFQKNGFISNHDSLDEFQIYIKSI